MGKARGAATRVISLVKPHVWIMAALLWVLIVGLIVWIW
jgi:hypothetical protein